MEQHEIARRRVGRILDHVAVGSDHPPPAASAHLFPMNCSSTLNTMVRRRDSTLVFARQASAYQGYFMQQSMGPENSSQQKLSHSAFCSAEKASSSQDSREPSFSRQAKTAGLPDYVVPAHDVPKFAIKGTENNEKQQPSSGRSKENSMCNDKEWSPRIDVAESEQKFFVTIELPGVTTSDVQVEVNNQSLIIVGKRPMHLLRVQESNATTYHQKGILRGPYRVVWHLPNNVNKERVSAELVDGFLQIILPKL